jgi:hypothetical protein
MYNLRGCNWAIYENHRIFTLVTLIDSFEDSLFCRRSFLVSQLTCSWILARFHSLLKIPDLLMSSSFQQLSKISIPRFRSSWDSETSLVPRFRSFRDSAHFKIRNIHSFWDSEISVISRFLDSWISEIPRFPRFWDFTRVLQDSEIFLTPTFWDSTLGF